MAITSFKGTLYSNFVPCNVEWEGQVYPTTEHAFQAAKTLDPVQRATIAAAATPGEAKRLGRVAVTLRPDWESVKYYVMLDLTRKKYAQEPFRSVLLSSGNHYLVEGNTWNDREWGCVLENGVWKGKNLLGAILMRVRWELQGCP